MDSAFSSGKGNQQRSLIVAVLNIILYIVILSFIFHAGNNVRLFTFPWSFREPSNIDSIIKVYKDVQNVSDAAAVRSNVYEHAMCNPAGALGNGIRYMNIHWNPRSVSPLCACLADTHDVYESLQQPTDSQETMKKRWHAVSNHVEAHCTKKHRPTQREGLSGETEWSATNIVVSTLLWNMVSLVSSLLSVVFAFEKKSLWRMAAYIATLATAGVCALMWIVALAVYSTKDVSNWLMTILFVVFVVVTAFMLFAEYGIQATELPPYHLRNQIVYWLGYGINLSLLFTSMNCLMHRQDKDYNIMFIAAAFAISINSLASDYVSYFKTAVRGKDDCDAVPSNTNKIHAYIWWANVILLLGIFNVSGPTVASTTFSNSQGVIWVTLLVLVLPIIILPNGMQREISDTHEFSNEVSDTAAMRDMSDLLSRFIFTAAVVGDLYNTSRDNSAYVS